MKIPSPRGYGPLAALDRNRHRGMKIREPGVYRFARSLNAVHLTVAEFIPAPPTK